MIENTNSSPINSKELNANHKICSDKKSCCRSFFSSKIFIAIVFLLLGICGTTLAQNIIKNRANSGLAQQEFSVFSYDPFFDNSSIFAQMENMQRKMDNAFKAHRQSMELVFKQAGKNGSGINKASVFQRNEKDSYLYELDFSGFKKEDVVVNIKDNILTFKAENKKENGDKNYNSYSSSSFYYSFSIPKYDTKKEPQITREDGKIIVKFAKPTPSKTK